MTSEEALQQYIDRKIPKDQQELQERAVCFLRAGWLACEEWRKKEGSEKTESLPLAETLRILHAEEERRRRYDRYTY